MNTFFCPWDKVNIGMTLATMVLVVATMAFPVGKMIGGEMPLLFNLTMGFTLLMMVGVLGYAIMTSPRRVEVTHSEVIIHCIGRTKRIERQSIVAARPFSSKGAIRTFGCGGFFGYLWWFNAPRVGAYFSYSVHAHQQTLLVTPRRNYVVSCERSDAFVALLGF